MYHPTTRVLAVLELLQTHGQISGADMARRLAVDARTLRRYIATLEQLGIPITSERGRHGGYALVAGFKLPPMMFSDDEALALSLGLLAARGLGLADAAPAVASAQAKLERVLPAGLRQRVRAIDDTVRLDLNRATAVPDTSALLALSVAAHAGQRVHLRYRADGRDSERDVDVYGLAWYGGRWYAGGYCHLRRALRTFRLDRIVQLLTTAQRFVRPAHFDVLVHLRTSVAELPRRFAATVRLKTDVLTAQRHLSDTIGVFEQSADGVLLHNQSDDLAWFARQLASLPFDVEVVGPPRLRAELAAIAARVARMAAA